MIFGCLQWQAVARLELYYATSQCMIKSYDSLNGIVPVCCLREFRFQKPLLRCKDFKIICSISIAHQQTGVVDRALKGYNLFLVEIKAIFCCLPW